MSQTGGSMIWIPDYHPSTPTPEEVEEVCQTYMDEHAAWLEKEVARHYLKERKALPFTIHLTLIRHPPSPIEGDLFADD